MFYVFSRLFMQPIFLMSANGSQYYHVLKGHNTSIVVTRVNIFQTETTIEIQLVRPTEVCGKV